MTSLFERIGGTAAVDQAVDIFYGKVTADPLLAGYFMNVPMGAQSRKLKAFLTMALGGASTYTGLHLRAAHQHMALTQIHFSAVAEHLGATLAELKVPEALAGEVMSLVATTRADVLNEPEN